MINIPYTGNNISLNFESPYNYNPSSKIIVLNQDNDNSTPHNVSKAVDSTISVDSATAGNPLIILILALSFGVLLLVKNNFFTFFIFFRVCKIL